MLPLFHAKTLSSNLYRCRESDSFLAGKRPENPDELNKPFLIPAADCTTAKIHDFALTLWFVVDGDGNLSGCGDKLGLGSMVALQVGSISIAVAVAVVATAAAAVVVFHDLIVSHCSTLSLA